LFQECLTLFILTYVTKYLFSNYIRNNKTKYFYVVLNILGQITVECQLFPSRSLYALLFPPIPVFSLACFLHVSSLPTIREYCKPQIIQGAFFIICTPFVLLFPYSFLRTVFSDFYFTFFSQNKTTLF